MTETNEKGGRINRNRTMPSRIPCHMTLQLWHKRASARIVVIHYAHRPIDRPINNDQDHDGFSSNYSPPLLDDEKAKLVEKKMWNFPNERPITFLVQFFRRPFEFAIWKRHRHYPISLFACLTCQLYTCISLPAGCI